MSGNTVNSNQLFTMTNSTDMNQNFDPSQADDDVLTNFNMADLDGLNAEFFGLDSGPVDSTLDGFATGTPVFDNFNFSRQPQETYRMPQSFNPSPATLAPPQGLPAMPEGLAFHPAVGYYYPIPGAPIPGFPSTGAFGTPLAFAAPQAPIFSQASVAPIVPAIPFETVLPDVPAKRAQQKRALASNKRKYGPAAFFEDQEHSKRRAVGGGNSPLPVKRDSDYSKKTQNASHAAVAMKEMNIATVMRCRCELGTSATEPHIPRPRNAFIIFRGDFSSRFRTSRDKKRGAANADISKLAGQMWRSIGKKGQAEYQVRAAKEKEEHRKQYPNYHYTPMKKIQARFGLESCNCGAYETNMIELKRLRDGGATPPNDFMASANKSEADDGEYKAPRTRSISRANSIQAPTAQMATYDLDADLSGLDFSLEPQEDWNFEALQALNNAVPDITAEQQPTTRRSSRSGKKAVHYADEAEENDDEVTTPKATQKHRPAPISTSRKSSNSSQLSALNTADFQVDDTESVSSRTRSKSVSQSKDEMALPTGLSSPSSLFGFDDDDIGDNVVVATPKVSPEHTGLALPPRTARQTRSQSRGRARRRS